MDFLDFRWFHEIDWPGHCGWATPDGQGSFRALKRAFPRCLKILESISNIFQVLVADTESSRSIGVTKIMKISKIHDSRQFSTFSSFRWLLVVSTTLCRPPKPGKCWKYCSNISKCLGNARFRAGKTPLTIWGGLPVLVGSLDFVNFQKSWKIMIFDDFRWFSSFPYSSAMGA